MHDGLDAAVELRGEHVVGLGDVLEREPVGDECARCDDAWADVLDQPRPLAGDRGLVHTEGEPLVHRIAEFHGAEQRTVGAHHRYRPALANAVDRPVQRHRGTPLHLQLRRGDVLEDVAVRFRADRVDGDVGSQTGRHLLQGQDDVIHLSEIHRLGPCVGAGLLQAVVEVIHHDHPPRSHEPGRVGGGEPHRPRPEHHRGIALLDVRQLGAEVPGRVGIGEEKGVLVVEIGRDDPRTDVGEGHPDELRLATVVPAGGVGIAVDRPHGGGVGVDVVAVGEQPAGAEEARSAVDVEGHHDAIADPERLDPSSDLVHGADELVAEGVADAGVGHHAVVQMQVRTADGGQLHLHDRVLRMLDPGLRLLLDPHLVRAAIGHGSHGVSSQVDLPPCLRAARGTRGLPSAPNRLLSRARVSQRRYGVSTPTTTCARAS